MAVSLKHYFFSFYSQVGFILSFFFLSCTNILAQDKPHWLISHPVKHDFYVGIGYSEKSDVFNYVERAREQALNNISSEIRIQINSESISEQIELNGIFTSSYHSVTHSISMQNISGYELVDVYETENDYWAFYRLSKNSYKQQILNEKSLHFKIAADNYENHLISFNNGNYVESLYYLLLALSNVEKYISPFYIGYLEIDDVLYVRNIHRKINTIFKNFAINEIGLLNVYDLDSSNKLELFATYRENDLPIHDLYLRISLSMGAKTINRAIATNSDGIVSFEIPKSIPPLENIIIKAYYDIEKLPFYNEIKSYSITDNLKSFIFRRELRIKPIVIGVHGTIESKFIENNISKIFSEYNVKISRNKISKYNIHYSYSTRHIGEMYGIHTVETNMSINIKNENGITVQSYNVNNIRGRHNNKETAESSSISNATGQIMQEISETIENVILY